MSHNGIFNAVNHLGWLLEPNVPVIGCGKARRPCWSVRGDYWLAGAFEKRLVGMLLDKYFNVKLSFTERMLVFHRVPSPRGDYAVEVFGEAARLGLVEYQALRGWFIYPSGALAGILAAYTSPTTVHLGNARGRLKGKKVAVDASACKLLHSAKAWVIVEADGYIGVAKPVDDCWLKVKDLAPKGFRQLPPARLEEAVEANSELIGGLASEARRFIRSVVERFGNSDGRVYVAFSGGVDSAAVLSLAVESLGAERVTAIYADTGIEFRETRRYAEKLASMLGAELEIVESNRDFIEEVARRGLMTRDRRWCTRLLKLEPLRRAYEKRRVRVVFEGARRWESWNRARLPRLGENPAIPGVKRALPVYHWPRLAIQLYLAERNIPVNSLYNMGLTRIGCIVCPAMHLYEIHIAYKHNKTFYHKLASTISNNTLEGLARILRGEWRKA